MARWYPGYEQRKIVFLDNSIPYGLASTWRSSLRRERYPGLYAEAQGEIVTPQNELRARLPKIPRGSESF